MQILNPEDLNNYNKKTDYVEALPPNKHTIIAIRFLFKAQTFATEINSDKLSIFHLTEILKQEIEKTDSEFDAECKLKIYYVDFQLDYIEIESDHLLSVMSGLGSTLTLYSHIDDGVIINRDYVLNFMR